MAERRTRERFKRRRRRKVCLFCAEKVTVDYKNVDLLKRFMTDRGKIMSRYGSGACAKHQRFIARAIRRARHLGLVPYTAD